MSMLAEPRRKQKIINLRAKNNAWSNDANKFGQRMLEKMGWSAGKGLGAKENGIIEHVIAKYKNDDKGLGYEDKNDQWTKHEDDFNALLANLSNGKDEKNDVLHSGISLEIKSKKSKARIHYHKFTRGKDLSKYSDKDLANIFGKKSFKEEVVDKNDKEEIISTERVFTEKGSMEDYFKSKMGALKFKNKIAISSDKQDANENQDFVFEGFSFTNDDGNNTVSEKMESFSFYNSENNKNQESTVIEYKQEKIPKKIKKNKKKSNTENVTDQKNIEHTDHVFEGFSCTNNSECTETLLFYNTQNNETQELPVEEPVLTKKKKKNKMSADTQECTFDNVDTKKSKKRKKDKNIEKIADCSEDRTQEEECDKEETYVPKKKKKRKNKDL